MSGDIVDLGNDRAQEFIDDCIAAARRGPKGEAGIGLCLFCGESLPDLRRWCDVDCRDLWDREQKRRAVQGPIEEA